MKLDLSKFKSVIQPAPPDQFEIDALRRENQLNDWVDPEPDDTGFALDPDSIDNVLYKQIHNYDYDDSDPKTSPYNDDIDGIPRYLSDIGWYRPTPKTQSLRSRLAPRGASR